MKIQNLDIRLLRVPNNKSGLSEFSGNTHPDPEVLKLIDDKGVYHIENRIKEVLNKSKDLHGSGYLQFYGLFSIQKFFDLQERVFFDLQEIVGQDALSKKDYTIKINPEYHILRRTIEPSHIKIYQAIKRGIILNEY